MQGCVIFVFLTYGKEIFKEILQFLIEYIRLIVTGRAHKRKQSIDMQYKNMSLKYCLINELQECFDRYKDTRH